MTVGEMESRMTIAEEQGWLAYHQILAEEREALKKTPPRKPTW